MTTKTDGHTLEDLARLHQEVDHRASRLEDKHAHRLECHRGCSQCCVDELTVFPVEAELIRRRHGELLHSGEPRRAGACAFLDDEGGCRIYDVRPYVCRTQGLPLRWFAEDERLQTVEKRDICPLNEAEEEPVEKLAVNACWTVGPYEARLRRLQQEFGGSLEERVRLRDLFRRGASPA